MTTEEIKAAIQSQIRTNGTGAITGAVLQGVLLDVLAGSKVTDLGNFTTDTALDAAVRSEALRVGEGDTGGVPGVKVILGSSSAGDQRNYLYFALSTGSQTRVVRIDPSTGHLQQTQKAKSASAWSAWAELYDTSGGGGEADPDAFVSVEGYTRNSTTLTMKFGKSGGGAAYETTLPVAASGQAGIMSGGDKSNVDKSVNHIEFWADTNLAGFTVYKNSGSSQQVNMPMALSGQAGLMSAADKIKLDGLTALEDLGTFATWELLRTSIVGTLPTFPAVAKVGGKQVLLLCDDNVSGGAGTRKVFAYDSGGALYALGCKLSGGRTTWDAAWTVTDLTAGSTGGTGMAIVNASEYNTGSLSGVTYAESATEGDIEAADASAVVWVKRLTYTGQAPGDLTGTGGRFYLRLTKGSAMTYYGSWPAVSAAVPGDAYYNQTATTGKAARVGMLFNFVQDGAVRFRSNEADADSLALLATVSTLGA